MKHLDLFSGIGGFALAAEAIWPDIEHIFCENDKFCEQILKKHWPHASIFGDIRELTADAYRERYNGGHEINATDTDKQAQRRAARRTEPPSIYLLTGGFPCQPFSQAGRRKGTSDYRFLWPEMLRVIREFKPRWVIGENVAGLLSIEQGVVFEQVCLDLEAEGYEVQPFVIPAVALNAPHRRDRVWIIGYAKTAPDSTSEQTYSTKPSRLHTELSRENKHAPHAERPGHKGQKHQTGQSAGYNRGTQSPDWSANWIEVATHLCRVDDGLPRRMDRNPRLKALGNAIVWQVAAEIMKAIKEVEDKPKI